MIDVSPGTGAVLSPPRARKPGEGWARMRKLCERSACWRPGCEPDLSNALLEVKAPA
jgi:hypothetical protein